MCVKCPLSARECPFSSFVHREMACMETQDNVNALLHQFSSSRVSLKLCARLGSSRTRLLSVCQLGALRCNGRSFELANDSDCVWPEETSASCAQCTPGTICQGKSPTTLFKGYSYSLSGFCFFCFDHYRTFLPECFRTVTRNLIWPSKKP